VWEEAYMLAAATMDVIGADGWGGGVVMGSDVALVDGDEDTIESKQYDTKVLEAMVLPGIGRRL
jgi:hypothetical protein